MTEVQQRILEYAKVHSYQASITDFINDNRDMSTPAILLEFKSLLAAGVVTCGPSIMDGWIGLAPAH